MNIDSLDKAIREIKYYQKHSDMLNIPRLSFCRLVRELAQNKSLHVERFTAEALFCLQHVTESYISDYLAMSYSSQYAALICLGNNAHFIGRQRRSYPLI